MRPVCASTDERIEFEKVWRDRCWGPAFANKHSILARLDAALSQGALVNKVGILSFALPTAMRTRARSRLFLAVESRYESVQAG